MVKLNYTTGICGVCRVPPGRVIDLLHKFTRKNCETNPILVEFLCFQSDALVPVNPTNPVTCWGYTGETAPEKHGIGTHRPC
jgi:hypothetical protein